MKAGMTAIMLSVFAALAGCGGPAPQPAPEEPETIVAQRKDVDDAMTMQGIDLYMHKSAPREGVSGKPELWVRAESLTIGDDNTYYFENARAVIYGKEDTEEVIIEAQRGGFEQDARAALEGNVRMTAGTLRMLLSDIEWTRPDDGTLGAARSDSPVIIDDPDLQLNAASLRLYPDTREFELTEVSGVVRFGGKLI
ncbi:MAG TPA: hypothetical protein ENN29_05105 [Candidatus Hydrogenedentes bacterium]|nr:hypothetical protein [Candidatus Hydrogenedentota bacterium]